MMKYWKLKEETPVPSLIRNKKRETQAEPSSKKKENCVDWRLLGKWYL